MLLLLQHDQVRLVPERCAPVPGQASTDDEAAQTAPARSCSAEIWALNNIGC
jgi:hypothetical protein